MKKANHSRRTITLRSKQKGVVLFIALISLVVIMLAAVALVRSVDTGNLIAGNVSFRRAATSSADAGVESAITWISAREVADKEKDPFFDASHVLNSTDAANGYYSNDPGDTSDVSFVNVTSAATWADGASMAVAGTDASGNSIRYVIQRMCKTADVALSLENCIFSDGEILTGSMKGGIPLPAPSGRSVMYRVTARVMGPRNTVSYVQTFVY